MPERVAIADSKPEPFTLCRLWFADGKSFAGVWTEKVWWAEGREVFPTHWETLARVGSVCHGMLG